MTLAVVLLALHSVVEQFILLHSFFSSFSADHSTVWISASASTARRERRTRGLIAGFLTGRSEGRVEGPQHNRDDRFLLHQRGGARERRPLAAYAGDRVELVDGLRAGHRAERESPLIRFSLE